MAALVPGFTILQHLGRGAGSHIFKAKDLATGKNVALKRVLRRSAEDDKYLTQTEHEYEIARRFTHRNLRRCLELRRIQEGGTLRELLLVMELVRGGTLERNRPTDPVQAVAVFAEIARGLGALHAMGLVHCDLKPRNVMLGRAGEVKIIDFGQTCPVGTVKERIQGTPDFLAPEQVRLDRLDERTDVFGLGATMYWALTGHGLPTPMPSDDPDPWPRSEGSLLHWRGPASPAQLNSEVPGSLSDLVMGACQERPRDRPASMRELIGLLEGVQHALGSDGEAARTSGPTAKDPSKLTRSS